MSEVSIAPGESLTLSPRDARESVALLESLLEHLSDGVVAVGRNSRVIYWSPSVERLSGIPTDEVLGQPVTDVLDALALPFQQSAGGDVTGTAQFPAGEIPLRVTVVNSEGPSGVSIGKVGALTDLRGEWEAGAEQKRIEALAGLGRTLATASHQLRNPLGAALGYLGLAEKDLEESPSLSLLEKVREGLLEIDRRIGDLLSYARPQPPRPESVDLVRLLPSIVDELKARFGGGPPIELKLPQQVSIRADTGQLRQAVENLLVNAVEEAGPSGRVSLLLQPPTEAREEGATNAVRLLVRNTGGNLPPGELPRLFEPFVTAKPGGTGLGLPLAKRIVESHRGSIEALSAGGWTTFVVTLPEDPWREAKE